MKKILTISSFIIFCCCMVNITYATLPTPNTIYPPCNGTNIPLPVNFQWSTSAGATWYHLQVLQGGINIVVDSNHIPITNCSILTLLSSTTYSWRVKAFNSSDSSGWSAGPCNFTTSSNLPPAPVLSLPSNNATNVSVTPLFVWYRSVNAQTYWLKVGLDTSNPSINIPNLTDTQYQVSTGNRLANGTLYYWKVGATNLGGTNWSSVWNFSTVPSPPPPPNLLTPPNGANNVSLTPTFTWNCVNGATSYELVIFPNSDTTFSNRIYDTSNIPNNCPITSFTLPSGHLSGPITYYWKVFSWNAGGRGNPSVVWHFTTITSPPPPPTLISPANNATCVSRFPTLSWNPVSGTGITYRIQVTLSSDPNFQSPLLNQGNWPATTYLITTNILNNNTAYLWHVNATNAGGDGQYSAAWNFTTQPPPPTAPTLVQPVNNATGVSLTPTVVWSHGANATAYHLQICANATFTSQYMVVDLNNYIDTSYMIPPGFLNGCHTYFWRVYSINCFTNISAAGGPFSFTTLSTINLFLKVLLEGFYNGTTMVRDTVRVYLVSASPPYNFVDSNKSYLTVNGTDTVSFSHAPNGNYYIVVRHRNHLETWSSIASPFSTCTYPSYDFTTSSSKAYGNNMKQVGSVWVLYGGDINQDGTIDGADYNYYKTEFGRDGYRPSDLNGDNFIDGYDLPILYSNFGVSLIRP
jgi:hypothetical protein